jgi:hypothetical protein
VNSDGDADVLIVKTALDYCSVDDVAVVADDTDIVVLMMYHWKPELNQLYFATEIKEGKMASKRFNYWNLEDLCSAEPLTQYLLFIHAWAGCDSTSAIHNKGLTTSL